MIVLPDGRSLSPESLQLLRKIAVRAVIELGMSNKEVAHLLGVGENAVGQWCAAYREHGAEGLDVQPLGRPAGTGRSLELEQEMEIQDAIRDTVPEDHGIASSTWTRGAVAELIRERFAIELTPQGIGKYLRRWNMTPQKPARHAREQDPEEVREFVEETLPDVVKRAEKEDGELHFTDETGAQVEDQIGASYAPRGETPVLTTPKTRIKQNVISSVTPEGDLYSWVFSETMNSEKFIRFLEFLVESSSQKIFLFADRHPSHQSGAVDSWLANHSSEIEMIPLPCYSPEYNPVEFLNNDLKQNLKHKPMPNSTPDFRDTILTILEHIATLPDRVKGFFREAKVEIAT